MYSFHHINPCCHQGSRNVEKEKIRSTVAWSPLLVGKKVQHKFHTDAKDSEDGIAKDEWYTAKVIYRRYMTVYM